MEGRKKTTHHKQLCTITCSVRLLASHWPQCFSNLSYSNRNQIFGRIWNNVDLVRRKFSHFATDLVRIDIFGSGRNWKIKTNTRFKWDKVSVSWAVEVRIEDAPIIRYLISKKQNEMKNYILYTNKLQTDTFIHIHTHIKW